MSFRFGCCLGGFLVCFDVVLLGGCWCFGWGCVVCLSDGLCICCIVGLLIILRCD